MTENLEQNILNSSFLKALVSSLREDNKLFISPLFGSSKVFVAEKMIKNADQIIFLFPDVTSVSEFAVELNVLGLEKYVINVTEFKPEVLQEKLTDISNREKFILISTYEILNHQFPLKEKVDETTTKIELGGNLSYDDLIEYFNLLNYQKDKFVEAPGDFSVRGSIIDFWSYSEKNPVRLEFDGDFLESIRYFEPESQRSIENVNNVTLAGAIDVTNTNLNNDFTDIFGYLKNPVFFVSSFEIENLKDQRINIFAGKLENESPEQEVNTDIEDEEFPEVNNEARTQDIKVENRHEG